MKVFFIAIAVLVNLQASASLNRMFKGHKVLKIIPTSEENLEQLNAISSSGISVDFWIKPRKVGKAVHMQVSPQECDNVKTYLKEREMEHSVIIEDVQNVIDLEYEELADRVQFKAGDDPNQITLDQYHNLQEIYNYIHSVAEKYPKLVSVIDIGISFEKQPLLALKIGTEGINKPAVFIDGGIHAREWITSATVVYIINELTTEKNYSDLLSKIDIYLMPVFNPDGYNFTWAGENGNRMWRKNRSGPRSGCYGVDLNRNWDYKWMVIGASSCPCDESYGGPSAFSEVEVQSVATFLNKNKANIKAYFTLHAYSELWMFPFGYADKTYPSDINDIREISAQAVAAIRAVNGTYFESGTPADILYPVGGGMSDYTCAVLNTSYSFALELRPSHSDIFAFNLPSEQIKMAAAEAWAGILVVLNRVASKK